MAPVVQVPAIDSGGAKCKRSLTPGANTLSAPGANIPLAPGTNTLSQVQTPALWLPGRNVWLSGASTR